MKKQGISIIILCMAICVSFGFSFPQEEEYYSNSFARLNYVKGDVFIQRAEDMGYEEGTVNLPVVEGDRLGTQDGRAEIHFGRKNYLRIDRYTQVDFVKLPQRGDDVISLHLFAGNIYLRVNSLNIDKEFEVHSPDGSFYILEEGLYRFEVKDNQETALYVVEGSLEAAGEGRFEIVRAGERLVAANGMFTFGPDYIYAAYEDAFTEWNRGRDVFHNRYVRTRYLPAEMSEYEAELDYYGRWVYERPYGYVWIPDVYHYSWKPYNHGRWVWYSICGWTWCSYEPWGWCVSHYGRWHWRVGMGWYWIPMRGWGPSWVHWYHGADYIGWCPLSYYNRPVVIVNNRFYGRHYDTYYPAHSRALTVIHKNQLRARQVSKVALNQSRVSRLGKVSLSSKQPIVRASTNSIVKKGSVAAKALSRTNVRSVTKGYGSGNSIQSSVGKNLIKPTGSPRISNRSGTVNKGSVTSSAKTRIQSRSSIKTYASQSRSSLRTRTTSTPKAKNSLSGSRAGVSRSSSQSSSSRAGIKTYPSQRSSVRKSLTSSASKARTNTSSTSRRSKSTIKKYSPRSTSSSRSTYPTPSRSTTRTKSSPSKKYSASTQTMSTRDSSSSSIKRYSSTSRSSISSALTRRSTPARSTYRSSPSRSSSSRSTYSTPSRSSSRIKSSSSRRSSSPIRITSPSRSTSSRSIKSTSRARVTRSSPSRSSSSRSVSRSRSSGKVKKK